MRCSLRSALPTHDVRGPSAAVWLVLALAQAPAPTLAQCPSCVSDSGNIETFLKNIVSGIPGCDTGAFVEPSQADRDAFALAIEALLDCNYELAAQRAGPQQYDLVQFSDTSSGRTYYVLREQRTDGQPRRGLGTYALNPGGRRLLSIQSPHARFDTATGNESVEIFVQTVALYLQLTGTSRCANRAVSGCDGCTSACGGCIDPAILDPNGDGCTSAGSPYRYRESDVAHYVRNFFQVSSDTLHAEWPAVVGCSVHGFGVADDPNTPNDERRGTSIVQISNGTTSDVPNSLSTQLALAYNAFLDNVGYAGAGAASFNLAPGEPTELQFVGSPPLPGSTNTQGRMINGAANPCSGGNVVNPELPERFLHVEQQRIVRRDPDTPDDPDFPGINWQITIDAFAAAFPTHVFVDFAHTGPETGGVCEPFNTVIEGVNAAAGSETVLIKAGSTGAAITLDTPAILRGFNGPAVMGRQ